MRVLYVHTTRLDSEKANVVQVLQMCKALNRQGSKIRLVVPEAGGGDNRQAARKILGEEPEFDIIGFHSRALFGRLEYLGQIPAVKRIVRELQASWRPDVCIVRHPVLLNVIANSGLSVVFETHSALGHNTSKLLDYVRRVRLVRTAKRPNVRLFVAISRNLGNFWLEQGVPKEKLIVLHDGFDPALFENSVDLESARLDLGLPVDRQIVTYAGSLYENRGIEVIADLADAFPKVLFVVVGGPEKRRQYLSKALKHIENLRFVGRVGPTEVPAYLAAANVLLMIWGQDVPTIKYCSPLKTFEYLAAGRMIVGHGYPTIKEVMTHNVHGLLTDPNSVEDLKQYLEKALTEYQTSAVPAAGRRLAFDKYTWDIRANLLRDALAKGVNTEATLTNACMLQSR